MTIDEMKQELIDAGYRVGIFDMISEIFTPDGLIIKAIFSKHEERAIQQAYEYMQKQKQFEALKALIQEEIEWASAPFDVENIHAINSVASMRLFNLVKKVKEILGE